MTQPGHPAAHRRFAGSAAAAFVMQSLGLLLAWGIQVALARMLPRSDFGVFVTVSALTATLAVPAALGLPVALVRFLPEYQERRDWRRYRGLVHQSEALVLGASLALTALAAPLLWLLSAERPLEARLALLLGLALVPALAFSSLLVQMLRAADRVAQAVWPPALLQPVLMLAGLVALVHAGLTLSSRDAVGLLLFSTVAALGLHHGLARRRLREIVGPAALLTLEEETPEYETRRWLTVAVPLLLTAGFQMLLAQMDILTMSVLRPEREVAVYGAAARLSRLILLTAPAVSLALGPLVAAAFVRGDLPTVQRAVTAAVQWTFWPSALAVAGLCVFGQPLLGLYGAGFPGAYPALCILSLGFLINAAAGPSLVLMNMTGHQDVVARVSGWTAAGGVAASLLLTAALGLVGAALASALAMTVWNVWLSLSARRLLGIRAFIWQQRTFKQRKNK